MRPTAVPLLVAGLLTASARAADAPTFPTQGEELKKIDWTTFFPAGDAWKKWEQVLVFNNEAEPKTLDPHLMTGQPEHRLALGLFEGLTSHHPATLQPLPGCAEWWEVSDDGTVYTFHLRKGLTWSNGDPLTAEDFRWSWQRAISPETASEYGYMLDPIRNAEEFRQGKVKDFAEVGVQVADPLTLKVTLRAPTAYFLEITAFETLMPVHRATVEKYGAKWTQPEHFVGNGPFVLAAWTPRDFIEFTPNPKWWNHAIVRVSRIRMRALEDQNTALAEYLSGGFDWIPSVPAPKVDEAQQHPDYYVSPFLTSYFFRFNTKRKPFDDVRVRKAFDLAVNKAEICEKVLKAGQLPATGIVPPGIHGYPQLDGLAYDPEAARKLLAEAGYPRGEGFPEVELLYNTQESHQRVCEVMVSMWREVLGVRVKPRNAEWQAYLEQVQKMDYQIARAGWIGDYADPNTFLDLWLTDGGNNNTGWSNAEYDALIQAAARERDPAKRMAMFQKAERMVCVENMPILPVYYYVNQGLLRPRVKGWYENIRDLHPLQYMYVDGPAGAGK